MQNLNAYVTKADGKQIRVCSTNGTLDSQLQNLGFTFDATLSMYVKDALDMSEKAKVFSELRDQGVAFSDGREWCPAELFEYFREQNLVLGSFKRVAWSDPQNFTIQSV